MPKFFITEVEVQSFEVTADDEEEAVEILRRSISAAHGRVRFVSRQPTSYSVSSDARHATTFNVVRGEVVLAERPL